MQNIINTILSRHSDLFGSDASAQRINIGFTNTIYSVNKAYIVKICTNPSKEAGFVKEINFYNSQKADSLFPKMYFADTSKKEIPYCYEILQQLDGVSLYNVWHTFDESLREDIIRQLCEIIKTVHAGGDKYDWCAYNKGQFLPLLEKANENNLFDSDETALL